MSLWHIYIRMPKSKSQRQKGYQVPRYLRMFVCCRLHLICFPYRKLLLLLLTKCDPHRSPTNIFAKSHSSLTSYTFSGGWWCDNAGDNKMHTGEKVLRLDRVVVWQHAKIAIDEGVVTISWINKHLLNGYISIRGKPFRTSHWTDLWSRWTEYFRVDLGH